MMAKNMVIWLLLVILLDVGGNVSAMNPLVKKGSSSAASSTGDSADPSFFTDEMKTKVMELQEKVTALLGEEIIASWETVTEDQQRAFRYKVAKVCNCFADMTQAITNTELRKCPTMVKFAKNLYMLKQKAGFENAQDCSIENGVVRRRGSSSLTSQGDVGVAQVGYREEMERRRVEEERSKIEAERRRADQELQLEEQKQRMREIEARIEKRRREYNERSVAG